MESDMASTLKNCRPCSTDSHRTRLLKDVLRSTEKLLRDSREFQVRQTGWKVVAGDKAGPRSGGKGSLNRSHSALNYRELHRHGLLGHPNGEDHLQEHVTQLDDCGARIRDLCDRLLAPALQMPPKYPPSDTGPHDGISILRRGDANLKETRAQAERTTDAYLGENVVFDRLEDLADRIERSPGHDELREQFPKRRAHHPNISLFSDYALESGAPFKEAIWASSSPFGQGSTGLSASQKSLAASSSFKASGSFGANRRAKGHVLTRPTVSRSNSSSENGSDRGGMRAR